MNKYFVWLLLLQFCATEGFSQAVRQPMGIPNLAINNLQLQPLTVPSLGISSNQTIAGDRDCACNTGCSVLPVKLLSFEAIRKNIEWVQLQWKTTNEFQNKGFEVQRSLGNTNDFAAIAFVPAQTAGAAVYEYELPDNNNYSGTSYYRLKQIDLDGNFVFSDIVPVKGYSNQHSLELYPNPVAHKLTADVFAVKRTNATLTVFDAAQKLVYSTGINLNKGINLLNVPVTKLGAGIYFIKIITEENVVLKERFVKL